MNELVKLGDSFPKDILTPDYLNEIVRQSTATGATALVNKFLIEGAANWIFEKYSDFKKKNKLRKDYKKILKSSLIELIKMLDNSNINEENIIFIKRLIVLTLRSDNKDKDIFILKEFLNVAKDLSPSEIAILGAGLKIYKDKINMDSIDIDDVYKDLAKTSKLKYPHLIARIYEILNGKLLVKDLIPTDKTRINNSDEKYIFSDFGFDFMEYLESYDSLKTK